MYFMMKKLFLSAIFLAAAWQQFAASGMTLLEKAIIFEYDMEQRFLLEGQALCKLRHPQNADDPVTYNMPDNCYMTGIYLGTMAMKYAVTQDEKDRESAVRSLNALHLLCSVSGIPGLWSRAVLPAGQPVGDDGIWRLSEDGSYQWRGDVSTDQVCGAMFGFALAHELIADDEQKKKIGEETAALIQHVLDNKMRIRDADGKPTQWGRYGPEYAARLEKLNALLWLQALKTAAHTSGLPEYADLYRSWALDQGYAQAAVRARRLLDPAIKGAVNHSDDMLLFLGYVPLLLLERDSEILDSVHRSVRRSWEGDEKHPGVQPEDNPFYAFIVAKYLGDTVRIEEAKNTLRWFPFDMKWNTDTRQQYEKHFQVSLALPVQSPAPEAKKTVPIDRRSRTWSAWVQDPYHEIGSRDTDSLMEYNGHDYLLGYWTGRYCGFISPEE